MGSAAVEFQDFFCVWQLSVKVGGAILWKVSVRMGVHILLEQFEKEASGLSSFFFRYARFFELGIGTLRLLAAAQYALHTYMHP